MILSLIAAYAVDGLSRKVIGLGNKIPWHSKTDLRRFKEYTNRHPIIMGRKTHESIGRILPGRENIILTSKKDYEIPGAKVFTDLQTALDFASKLSPEIFIIGGQNVYEQTINAADRLYLTRILLPPTRGDAFFPKFSSTEFKEIHQEKNQEEVFSIFQRHKKHNSPTSSFNNFSGDLEEDREDTYYLEGMDGA